MTEGSGIDLGRGVYLDPDAVTWRFSTAGGPGGQHVNTSNTKAEAALDVGTAGWPEWAEQVVLQKLGPVVTAAAGDTRSQARNRDLALGRLADQLRAALAPPPPPRRATRPTAASKRRRLEQKKRRAQVKRNRGGREATDDG
jgi:ribosome-associated protein